MNIQIIDPQDPLWHKVLQQLRHDVYHLPEYIGIESNRTETMANAFLVTDSDKIFFVPYLLRQCNDVIPQELLEEECFDIVSPYGYPGILLSEAAANTPKFVDFALHELKYFLQKNDVCSAFLRLHPLLSDRFKEIFPSEYLTDSGKTVSINLTLSESEIWAHTRKGHQSTINKCKRLGFTGRIVEFRQYIDEFIAIYEETMNRVNARQFYYFSRAYFEDLLSLGENIHLGIVEVDNEIACASLFFECYGIVQAHLGGTKTKYLHQSPFNFLLHYVRLWAKERGNEFLHIGGGVGGSTTDSLYTFKSGFSRQKHDFLTLKLITNEEKYYHLVNLRAKVLNTQAEALLSSDFFPVYRSYS